jgi:hypothetical protein
VSNSELAVSLAYQCVSVFTGMDGFFAARLEKSVWDISAIHRRLTILHQIMIGVYLKVEW